VPKTVAMTITCDICLGKVDAVDSGVFHYIDAAYYNSETYHLSCWERIGGPALAKRLNLSDITRRHVCTDAEVGRAW
jgi:hypothetical protein